MQRAYFISAFLGCLYFTISLSSHATYKAFDVFSPDKHILVKVECTEAISFTVFFKGKSIIRPSVISMDLQNGTKLGTNPIVIGVKSFQNSQLISNVINGRRKQIKDEYNETRISLKGNYAIVFRVYNEGMAYRLITDFSSTIKVKNEQVSFNFADDYPIYYIPKVQYDNSGEGSYLCNKISEIPDSVYGLSPLLVKIDNGPMVVLTEASLFDYAGLNFKKSNTMKTGLSGFFAPDVLEEEGNVWVYKIKKRKNFIAETSGVREFPWRVMVIVENEIELTDCDIVYKLSKPMKESTDVSWVKSGKAAWDWWADWNISGVDFIGRQGSFDYYKYMIDFAASNKLEFIEISVGWMDDQDILKVNPEIRMPELISYAKNKNVDIMVWVVAHTLERQFKEAFELFSAIGVAGIKVDFLDADHQGRVLFYERIARECMKRKLMVYYHGSFKPTGLERTYPCIINYEGVQANEHNKWSKEVTPKHNINVAFIRNLAGPMDMNLGPMRNAQPDYFHVNYFYPMSQGTRCHQMAMYVVYFAPFNMVADAPNEYLRDEQCIRLISSIPSNWDDSKPIEGRLGDYLIIARRKGNSWYLGGMNNEVPKDGKLALEFLGEGEFTATIFSDGINAGRLATDYKVTTMNVNSSTVLDYKMVSGGGFVWSIIKNQ